MATENKNNQYHFSAADIRLIKDLLSLPEDHIDYNRIMSSVYGHVDDMTFIRERMNSVRRVIADKEWFDIIDNELAKTADPECCSSESYEITKATNMGELQQMIFFLISSSEVPLSRADICNHTQLRMSTVTARCRELVKMGLIRSEGTKLDPDSKRKVGLLVARIKS